MRNIGLPAGGFDGIHQGIEQKDRAVKPCPFFVCSMGYRGCISVKSKIKSHKRHGSGQKTFEVYFSFPRFRSSVERAKGLRQGRTYLVFEFYSKSSVYKGGAFASKIWRRNAAVFEGSKTAPPNIVGTKLENIFKSNI